MKQESSNTVAADDDDVVKRIKELLENYVKPAVEMDGGAIQFKSYDEGVVNLMLQGSCSGCPSSMITLKAGIEGMMKRMIPEVKEVVCKTGTTEIPTDPMAPFDTDVIIVLDVDLSYSVEYIETLADTLKEAVADIVIASPYMEGGKVTAVPFSRRVLSRWVNKFMRMAAQDKYHTFTGMVRAYRRDFIRTVNLKTKDYEVNPEIMYKAMILRARIVEIPAHLDWTEQNKFVGQRKSSLRVLRSFFSGIMSGFIFRPYIFFVGIGTFLMLLSLYELIYLLYDTLSYIAQTNSHSSELISFPQSLAVQFQKNPQTFLVGGITFVIAIQFLSVGFLSLQSKRYFEELFHLGTTALKKHTVAQENS